MGKMSKAKTLRAIEGSRGVTATVAKRLGVAWTTAQRHIEAFPETKEAFEVERELMLDQCEETLFDAVEHEKDVQTSKWLLSKLGKSRGYGDSVEHSGPNGGPIETQTKQVFDLGGGVRIVFDGGTR